MVLVLIDQQMFNSPIDGRLVSPDIDMREWMAVAYSSVKCTTTEKALSNWGFVRCPPAHAVQMYKQGRGSALSMVMGTNDYDLNFLTGHDLGNAVYSQ